jgi:hypothetical protein
MVTVLGIKIIDRIKEAGLTQDVLSRHSSIITTRLGFHEVTDEVCSREAYIILHLNGDPQALVNDLPAIGGIEIRKMSFTGGSEPDGHPVGKTEIIGLLVNKDRNVVNSVQKVLTSYGCNIRTRLGVNELFFGEPAGLIILELKGDEHQRLLLEKDLRQIEKVQVRKMVF